MKKYFWLVFAILITGFLACDDDGGNGNVVDLVDNAAGLTIKERPGNFDAIVSSVKANAEGRGFTIIAEVDHQAAASGVGITMPPTTVVMFGNPVGGTPLMEENQRIGIDLPLKVLIYEKSAGNIQVAYYNGTTLLDRYNIDDDDSASSIDGALFEITAGSRITEPVLSGNISGQMIVKTSPYSASATLDSLEKVLMANDFNIVAKVEHDLAAEMADLELRPTKLIIFGKPAVGSQLMQSDNQIGIDLPMKMLIWEDFTGMVRLGYFPADLLAARHSITDKNELVNMINTALNNLSNAAIQ